MRAQTGKFTLCGDGLCVGYDSADAISKHYSGEDDPSYPFTGGTIESVVITTEEPQQGQLVRARLLEGAFAAD